MVPNGHGYPQKRDFRHRLVHKNGNIGYLPAQLITIDKFQFTLLQELIFCSGHIVRFLNQLPIYHADYNLAYYA